MTEQTPDTRNQGHGHVYPRFDGARARCGGPGICSMCSYDQAKAERAKSTPTPKDHPMTEQTPDTDTETTDVMIRFPSTVDARMFRERLGLPQIITVRENPNTMRKFYGVTLVPKPMGEEAYQAYYKAVQGISPITGGSLPYWEGLTPTVQAGWHAAADAIRSKLKDS